MEAALCAHPAVSEAGVVASPDRNALRAFVTVAPGAAAAVAEIRAQAAALLPSYALPDHIEIRDGFARTSTGKIDRKALAAEVT